MSDSFEQYPSERRRSPRVPGNAIEVEYFTDSGDATPTEASVRNICIHGICLFLPEVVEGKDTINMKILLPGRKDPLRALGSVVWYSAGDREGFYNVGIEFLEISDEDQKLIADFVERALKSS